MSSWHFCVKRILTQTTPLLWKFNSILLPTEKTKNPELLRTIFKFLNQRGRLRFPALILLFQSQVFSDIKIIIMKPILLVHNISWIWIILLFSLYYSDLQTQLLLGTSIISYIKIFICKHNCPLTGYSANKEWLYKVSPLVPDHLFQRADTPQMYAALMGNERQRTDTC